LSQLTPLLVYTHIISYSSLFVKRKMPFLAHSIEF